MVTNCAIFAVSLLLSIIPGFLTKPAELDGLEAERRWADPRADMGAYGMYNPVPSDVAYKKNQQMHAGNFESSYKVTTKKVRSEPLDKEVLALLNWYLKEEKSRSVPNRKHVRQQSPLLGYTYYGDDYYV